MAKYIKLYEENPDPRKLAEIAESLRNGGIVIYPTDTIYGMGCDLFNVKAMERLLSIKGTKAKNHNLSFICYDLSHISEYARSIDNTVFKAMKRALPGPYTFILNSSSKVPKLLNVKKRTVGIRVPDNYIPRSLVKELGNPIVSTSIRDDDEIIEYSTDPELIFEKFKDVVDIIVDGGFGDVIPSTVVNCADGVIEILREGKGDPDIL